MQDNNHNRVVNILEFRYKGKNFTLEFSSEDPKPMVYQVTDEVSIPDGVYFATNGFFSVYLGRIVSAFTRAIPCDVYDRHGNNLPYPL